MTVLLATPATLQRLKIIIVIFGRTKFPNGQSWPVTGSLKKHKTLKVLSVFTAQLAVGALHGGGSPEHFTRLLPPQPDMCSDIMHC